MSRYCGGKNINPILDAAAHWRDVALVGGGSVLGEQPLWTIENLRSLEQHFVENPDEGDGKFLEKLRGQIAETGPTVQQLAAEMMWAMYLCPSSVTQKHKREVVTTVWSWSGAQLQHDSSWLSAAVFAGVGSAGPGFNLNLWRELIFMIRFALAIHDLPQHERKTLLSDPWRFAEWLLNLPEADARQLRHMLVFMLFPDQFERIFGQGDRLTILRAFTDMPPRAVTKLDPVQIDRALYAVRKDQEKEHGTTELDFYDPPLKQRWVRPEVASQMEDIQAAHVLQALSEIDQNGIPANAESTEYDLEHEDKRYPPKLVLSLASKYATGEELDRRLFSGGVDASAFRLLTGLGFTITHKVRAFFLLRSNASSAYDDELGKQYHFVSTVPNSKRLALGATVVVDRKEGNKIVLLGYGELEPAVTETQNRRTSFVSSFKSWQPFDPPRLISEAEKAAIQAHPKFNVQHAVRPLSAETFALLTDQAGPIQPLDVEVDLKKAVAAFADALSQCKLRFGTQHDGLVTAFVASLVTKPLVILTGLSGSGKTQIAMRFGEWLGGEDRIHVAAVRPDWSGPEALFGYEDGLKPAEAGRAAWAVPDPLKFILKAHNDPAHPYLLVLDEMNLAHVERYLADALSGIESGQPCLPNLETGADGLWRCKPDEPRVPWPRNLWIVGTVNVDETTYMFSPKVLDRANTFEFRVNTPDLSVDATKPSTCEAGEPALVRGILAIGRDDDWHITNKASFQAELAEQLKQLHSVLHRYNYEFGHRVFYEAMRFAALAERAGLVGLTSTLDRIVLQKVLPRLHGSRRRLELPLLALAHYCRDLGEVAADQKLPALKPEVLENAQQAKLPLAHDKVCRMLTALRANQFASFTE